MHKIIKEITKMSKENNIKELNKCVLDGLKGLIDADTIIGTPIYSGDITIVPVSKAHFGYASGGSDIPSQTDLFAGGTGCGVTLQPIAFIVINGQNVQILNVPTADNTADRIVNSIPVLVDKIKEMLPKKDKDSSDEDKKEK
jgi:sporulation protein YtfJ